MLRNKEHLCLIKPYHDILLLNRLRFAEEIRDTAELKGPAKTKPKVAEMKMAMTLIDHLTKSFNIDKFKDTYSAELMKHIKAKAKGQKVKVSSPMKVTHRKTNDLMTLLKSSIKKAS